MMRNVFDIVADDIPIEGNSSGGLWIAAVIAVLAAVVIFVIIRKRRV